MTSETDLRHRLERLRAIRRDMREGWIVSWDDTMWMVEALEAVEAQVSALTAQVDGVGMIAAERRRQVEREGWTPQHDDAHGNGELVAAAICYAEAGSGFDLEISARDGDRPTLWPWEPSWWKPSDDLIRNLAKAGALIAAEIDRLQRLDPPGDPVSPAPHQESK